MEGIERHPVSTLAHNLNTVDHEAEISVLAVGRIGALKLDGSYTEARLFFVDKLALGINSDNGIVNVCFAVAARPPKLRI